MILWTLQFPTSEMFWCTVKHKLTPDQNNDLFSNNCCILFNVLITNLFFFCREKQTNLKTAEKCSRTFITFTDEKIFKTTFFRKREKVPGKQYCPVTKLPAKYFDPVTATPYANAQAFKIIRDAYQQHLQQDESLKRKTRTAVTETAVSSWISLKSYAVL